MSNPLVEPTQIVKGDLVVVSNLVYEVKSAKDVGGNHGWNAPVIEMILVPPKENGPETRIMFYLGGVTSPKIRLFKSAGDLA
jgi:hypothetical protein